MFIEMKKYYTKDNCPKFCDGKGCHYTIETRNWDGKKEEVTIVHCKALDKISANAMSALNKAFSKL